MSSLIKTDDRFFVAGARGMAGSAICRALKKKGYGDAEKGGHLLIPNRQELDLLNHNAVNKWYIDNKPDVVILAAAKVGGIYANDTYPADFLLENLKIQTNVIEGAWRSGVRRFLFLGSSCIYPKFAEQPIKEESLLTGSLESTNEWYAMAKISGIKLCESLRKQYGFDAISLMPTNLYGPGDNYHPQNSHVLPAMIRRFDEAVQTSQSIVTCWGTGSPMREFLHVDDLGKACVFALENWSALASDAPKDESGEPLAILNVGTGLDCTIKQLAEQVAASTGFLGEIKWDHSKPDGTRKKLLDVSRLQEMGWTAKTPLACGIPMAFEDFRKAKYAKSIREE